MAIELQACRFLVLVILVGFFLPSSTIQARTLHTQTHDHHAIMKPTGSHGVMGYCITEVLGLWSTNNSHPFSSRRELSVSNPEGGPSRGDNN
jgi:hypothetical protein